MKFNKNILQKKWAAYAFAGCITVLFYLAVSHIGGLFEIVRAFFRLIQPVLVGAVIAYVLNPLVRFFEGTLLKNMPSDKARHTASVVLTILAVIVSVMVLLTAMIPQIINSAMRFFDNFSTYSAQLIRLLNSLDKNTAFLGVDLSALTDISNQALRWLTGFLDTSKPGNLIDTSFSIGMSVFNLVISFILAIYFLGDRDRLVSGAKRLMHAMMPETAYNSTLEFCSTCHDILIRYIIFELIDGMMIAVINLVLMMITGVPYKAVISVVVGITNLAPTFGPIIGGVIGCFILVMVNPWFALTFLIITIVLQTFDGYILKPKLFGNSLGVPGVWILVVIIIGGRLFGVIGILLAIPFAAIVDIVYSNLLERREAQQIAESKKKTEAKMAEVVDVHVETRKKHKRFE